MTPSVEGAYTPKVLPPFASPTFPSTYILESVASALRGLLLGAAVLVIALPLRQCLSFGRLVGSTNVPPGRKGRSDAEDAGITAVRLFASSAPSASLLRCYRLANTERADPGKL